MNSVIGVDQVSASLLPAIVELAQVPVWRIRLAVINQMPLLADQLGEGFFGERLMQHFLDWLADAAYAVREAAVYNLTRLTEKFGPVWAKNFFLSEVGFLAFYSLALWAVDGFFFAGRLIADSLTRSCYHLG